MQEHIEQLSEALKQINPHHVQKAASKIIKAFKEGNKLLICGNGGSNAEAQHMAAEFVGRFKKDRDGYPAIALSNSADITALGNDFGYERIFSRQIQAFGKEGDVLIALSTSGDSLNVRQGIIASNLRSIKTIALLGTDGGSSYGLADQTILVASDDTAIIQECHLVIIHEICRIVDEALC